MKESKGRLRGLPFLWGGGRGCCLEDEFEKVNLGRWVLGLWGVSEGILTFGEWDIGSCFWGGIGAFEE